MDFVLRCNSLKCRSQLTDWAVVTTCSHIFCLPCADALGLASATNTQRICPACNTALPNPDDAVRTQLNPTEDYKTSVLSGLSPAIITECAGRALTFWSYQSSQEIVYQEFLAKSLTERYGELNVQLDKIINDANSQIENLNQRMQSMQLEQDKLRSENMNIATALKEKTRKHQQAQELYDRLKRKEMAAVAQNAAFDSADDLLNAAQGNEHGFPPGLYGNSQNQQDSQDCMHSISGVGIGLNAQRRGMSSHGGHGQYISPEMATPQHRQRLGAMPSMADSTLRSGVQYNKWQNHPTGRQPLGPIHGNAQTRSTRSPGTGASAALRQGTPQVSRMAKFDGMRGGHVG